jgi:hypothetical protein
MSKLLISFDLVMEEDMQFVEGCFRFDGEEWMVFVASKYEEVAVTVEQSTWQSGARGLVIRTPRSFPLSRESVAQILCSELCATCWDETKGPDSMKLR